MKNIIILCVFLISMGFVNIAAANPGILVTVDPLSQSALSGTTIDYSVTISDIDGFIDKTITYLDMEIKQPGWTYTIEALPTSTLPAGGSVTTIVHVTIPFDAIPSDPALANYSHSIRAIAEYELYPSCSSIDLNPTICLLIDNTPQNFDTFVLDNTPAPIPEFPTVALPIITVLGLVFLMSRRK